jgi:hypothetical protein
MFVWVAAFGPLAQKVILWLLASSCWFIAIIFLKNS